MERYRLLALAPQTAMSEHLEVLRRGAGRRCWIVQAGGETLTLQRPLWNTRDGIGQRLDPDQLQ